MNDLVGPPAGLLPIHLAAAVNNPATLEHCLRRSPDIVDGAATLRIYEGFTTAGAAYNKALADSATDVVVLVHQDVYLPAGFVERLRTQLIRLAQLDPQWAIAGVIGKDQRGAVRGQTWSSGIGQLIGHRVSAPTRVVTLDEVLLVVRKAAGIAFDPNLPSFHLYAADVVQTAKVRGLGAYVLDLPIVHHSRAVVRLDAGYRSAYRYMQKKWRAALPIPNLVCPIHRSSIPLLVRDARIRWARRRVQGREEPAGDPVETAQRLGMEQRPPDDSSSAPPPNDHDLGHEQVTEPAPGQGVEKPRLGA